VIESILTSPNPHRDVFGDGVIDVVPNDKIRSFFEFGFAAEFDALLPSILDLAFKGDL
jgi:hypothetical protein